MSLIECQATGRRADRVVPWREGIRVQVPSGDARVIVEGRCKDRKDASKVSLEDDFWIFNAIYIRYLYYIYMIFIAILTLKRG